MTVHCIISGLLWLSLLSKRLWLFSEVSFQNARRTGLHKNENLIIMGIWQVFTSTKSCLNFPFKKSCATSLSWSRSRFAALVSLADPSWSQSPCGNAICMVFQSLYLRLIRSWAKQQSLCRHFPGRLVSPTVHLLHASTSSFCSGTTLSPENLRNNGLVCFMTWKEAFHSGFNVG